MGVELKARNLAQVSINLTDFETTPVHLVFDAVAREAAAEGVSIEGSEVVGLIPRQALEQAAVRMLKIEKFHPEMILENRLARVLEAKGVAEDRPHRASSDLRHAVDGFVAAVAAATPTPGGGSVCALTGALGAALGEMVGRLTLARKSFAPQHPVLEKWVDRLKQAREQLLENVDRDAQSYEAVMAAMKLPQSTEQEKAARANAIEGASKLAATVPAETAELATQIAQVTEALRAITIPQAASDLAVAAYLAKAARQGALENVRANLPSIRDRQWVSQIEGKVQKLETKT